MITSHSVFVPPPTKALSRSPETSGSSKAADLSRSKEDGAGEVLTTNQGLRINDDQNSLKAGPRGPSLLEDFHLREKITHFDHERIPERIVHARGSGAHGFFQVYENMSRYTKAGFLQDPSVRTPVFVRFSTVAGSRGSTDLARDARGFAVKFYTQEGIYDLVGNNIPVFFIQDAIKFPDLIHAVKPEPDNEMPQAGSAHDTFWDFISLMPETMPMIMWVMSDRAIPRTYRMMEGFGVHTFRFVDAEGASRFVKFHWKPLLGVHSVAWDEAQKISGKDSGFHRRDLWEAIEQGHYPEWELGVQIVEEAREHDFDFDFVTFPGRLEGSKVRERSEKFFDHFSQAALSFRSQSDAEKDHLVEALRFELGKLERPHIRQRMVTMLQLVDESLALRVAEGLGMTQIPKLEHPLNHSVPADGDPARFQPVLKGPVETTSPALSMANTVKDTVLTRKVAILASDGADTASIRTMQDALLAAGAQGKVVATHLGVLKGAEGDELPIDFSLLTTSSVLFDAVYVPGGAKSAARLALERDALEFVTDAYRHCKPMAATAEGAELLKSAGISGPEDEGILTSPESLSAGIVQRFLESIARHRFWSRGSRNRIGPPTSDGTRGGAIRTPGA